MKNTYTGSATVFRHDKEGRTYYSVAVSRRNSNGDTIFGYKPIQFKRGVEVADRVRIDIQKAWETFYLDKEGKAVFYVFVSDFTIQQESMVGYQQPQQYAPQYPQNYGQQPQGYAPQNYGQQMPQPPQYQQPAQYPTNTVAMQFGAAPQYPQQQLQPQPQPQAQPQQSLADEFEAIDEEVPF